MTRWSEKNGYDIYVMSFPSFEILTFPQLTD